MRITFTALSALIFFTGCNKAEPVDLSDAESYTESASVDDTEHEKFMAEMEASKQASLKAMKTLSFTNYLTWDASERKKLGYDSQGSLGPGPKDLCQTMGAVGLGCGYDERITLANYLAANGVNLFPCGDGSNPYFATESECQRFDLNDPTQSFFIGQPGQNEKLRRSIQKNAGLFKNGDLTPEAASAWKS